ncbi:hypothetical protein K488DRAFT_59864 [Vararia minispora EC-137]|uniref:Uncharacterized protein n=1 Tax=Vararia minispora EC-137 TaxID=1314806 RepID=A0ACB8Q8R9_9AGAM|nr:hypothetical protein K488DRAFT_59864 [Vararia minispora EC-137]
MVEYVYALHDFIPENEDEVPFRAGERIEIVEKDDLYGDGWWQGRNLGGRVGLFPASYTQVAPAFPQASSDGESSEREPTVASVPPESQTIEPTSSTGLLPLLEEPEPSQSTGKATPNGEVMRATLTDVQKAIEQLGKHADTDGARSFTFSSLRDGDTTDRDTEYESDAQEGEDWYKATRQKLAERARQQVQQARTREAIDSRATIPPIDVDFSDESADEEEDAAQKPTQHRDNTHIHELDGTVGRKTHPIIPPVRLESPEPSPLIEASDQFIVPSPLDASSSLLTATQASFPPSASIASTSEIERDATLSPRAAPVVTPSSVPIPEFHPLPTDGEVQSRPSTVEVVSFVAPSMDASAASTPANVSVPSPSPPSTTHTLERTSSSTRIAATSPLSQSQTFQDSLLTPSSSALKAGRSSNHPNDWTVDEVVEWLKLRGFDDGVCDKFIEQEITGDVLLELDVNVLKSEIGIMAFGKRMRIANAIAELRRPPSVMSEHMPTSASPMVTSPGPGIHSFRSHSQSQSVVTTTTHVSSPYTPASVRKAFAEVDTENDDFISHFRHDSDPGVGKESRATLGSTPDVSSARGGKGRPSQLTLSPSDSALGTTVKAVSEDVPDSADSDRIILSEVVASLSHIWMPLIGFSQSEAVPATKYKCPLKDTATQSARSVSKDRVSEAGSLQHARKRSTDASKPAGDRDRHSLFGSAFTSTLGRSRKPPPRYSGVSRIEVDSPEKSGLSLSRLVPGAGRKSSGRPQTSDGTPGAGALAIVREPNGSQRDAGKRDSRDSGGSKERRDPALLRKRTSSAVGSPVSRDTSGAKSLAVDRTNVSGSTLKAGKSILQQIGVPDHNGWMRKKGERYNVWKTRYFVLKGPHLYWLRSNNPSEVRIKGYVNTTSYRIVADEKVDPGKYGFKLIHDTERPHMFSSDEQSVIREWMKALMKAAIDRDYTRPVISSVNIPTIPLAVAQAMNPAPRPPSPTARAATQKALRRENTNQLSTRDAQVLMGGVPLVESGERARVESVFSTDTVASVQSVGSSQSALSPAHLSTPGNVKPMPPSRPSRELRRITSTSTQLDYVLDPTLVEWVNSHVPHEIQLTVNSSGPLCIGLTLLRLAESIKGVATSPPVPDTAFPTGPEDDKLEGLFRLFDFLLDNDVRMGSVSINDIRQGRADKVIQLLKALRSWEEKRRAITRSIGKGGMSAGGFVAPVGWDG